MNRANAERSIFICCIVIILVTIGYGGYRYYQRYIGDQARQQLIDEVNEKIIVFKSLGFGDHDRLITVLSDYAMQLENAPQVIERDKTSMPSNINPLTAVTKKMLKSYMSDVRQYREMGIDRTDTIMRFSHDKIVRLTLCLAELEKCKRTGLPWGEYTKKIGRLREITNRSIVQGQQALRKYRSDGFDENDARVIAQRDHLTKKMCALIELDTVLY